VNIESDFDHPLDNSLYLVIGGSFLHCNYHGYFPVLRGSSAPGYSPLLVVAELPLDDANSSRCNARITSMMRS
jgi:hypothetical protein